MVTGETTIAQLDKMLRDEGVGEIEIAYGRECVVARVYLRALGGPQGREPFHAEGRDAIDAINRVLSLIRAVCERRVRVRAASGKLIGLYADDDDGREWAKRHARHVPGAVIEMP